jgi:hypothetical protein
VKGSDHYRKAERLLAEADGLIGEPAGRLIATAQVHATLAHTAVAVVGGGVVSKAWADVFAAGAETGD